jgi:hypothetical protein
MVHVLVLLMEQVPVAVADIMVAVAEIHAEAVEAAAVDLPIWEA